MKTAEWLKSTYGTATIIAAIITAIVTVTLWASDVKKKIDAAEQIQVQFATQQTKMLDFVMRLWQIEPETRNKWKKLNWEPTVEKNGDTANFSDWYEIIGLDYILHYKATEDSTGALRLYVDTLYKYEGE